MTEHDIQDAEQLVEAVEDITAPVDPPDALPTTWADITRWDEARQPVIPAWLRSRRQRRQVARWAAGYAGYVLAFHATRSPKYLVKTSWYATRGATVGVVRLIWWARAEEGSYALRQHAASRGDADRFVALDRQRQATAAPRWRAIGALAVTVVVGVGVLASGVAPDWVSWTVGAGTALLLARLGRPNDRRIVDRVTPSTRFVKLTAEMVRGALCSIGLTGIRDPAAITFPQEIHRDGPGYLARVDLPGGVEAVDVMERRGKLSSALRLPVDQVWPAAGPGHAGQLDLWIGYQPASKMGQPRWSLAAGSARTSVFEPFEFGTDERQRPVCCVLFERNFLIGGVPGSGKSYAARAIVLGAALDPTVELKIAEFKGTADFGDLAPLCSSYVCGVDDQAIEEGAKILAWGLAEAERRGRRIRAARERGEAPEGKVTPALASRPGSGLHPVLIVIDEAHELLVNKEAAAAAVRLIKRGRALGITVVLATQIPDKSAVPPSITRCVTVRWCLAVQDQIANDMILGTGAYKRGLTATVYRPGEDAGWGCMTGLSRPMPVRSHYPDAETTAAIVARAAELRGGRVVGDPHAVVPVRDLLDDVIRVWSYIGRPGVHWQHLAQLLATHYPEAYGDITPDAVSTLLRDKGVPSVDVKVGGLVLKGCRRDAVDTASGRREVAA